MFDDPSQGYEAIEPGRYIVKLVRFEQTSHAEYGPGIKWVFHVANPATDPPTLIYQQDGTPYEFFQITSPKLGPKSKKARPWLEALLGRPIVEGQDTGDALAKAVVGKKAAALIGPNDGGYSTIHQMFPLGGKAAAVAAPSPAVEALNSDLSNDF